MGDFEYASIIFLGDVMLGRLINVKDCVSKEIVDYVRSSNLRVCNLECVVTRNSPSKHTITSSPCKYICKHGADVDQAQLLIDLHVELCNLANNHILDYGIHGVKDTIDFLNENTIKWFGFGKNWQTAWKPRICTISPKNTCGNGLDCRMKLALIGLSDHYVEWKASSHAAGINYFDIKNFNTGDAGNPNHLLWTNIDVIYDLIQKVRSKCDIVVFSIHWGDNFQEKIDSTFQLFARLLIEHGVDIIHGHSAHHVHGIETYKSRLILYGCGEFLNDYEMFDIHLQLFQNSLGPEYAKYNSELSFIYKLFLKPTDGRGQIKFDRLELFPIEIKDGKVDRCSNEKRDTVQNKMIDDCSKLSTDIVEENNRLYIYF